MPAYITCHSVQLTHVAAREQAYTDAWRYARTYIACMQPEPRHTAISKRGLIVTVNGVGPSSGDPTCRRVHERGQLNEWHRSGGGTAGRGCWTWPWTCAWPYACRAALPAGCCCQAYLAPADAHLPATPQPAVQLLSVTHRLLPCLVQPQQLAKQVLLSQKQVSATIMQAKRMIKVFSFAW